MSDQQPEGFKPIMLPTNKSFLLSLAEVVEEAFIVEPCKEFNKECPVCLAVETVNALRESAGND